LLILAAAAVSAVALWPEPDSGSGSGGNQAAESGVGDGGASDPSGGTNESNAPQETVAPEVTSSPTTVPPAPATPYANRDEIYEETVAVVWSEVGGSTDPALQATVRDNIASFESRFSGEIVGFRGDDFGSTKPGTVGVAHRGGFSSAEEAARWCRDNGLDSNNACFGLRLSDDFTWEDRGVDRRWYPAQLG